jgi:hypothetical protein
MTVKNILYFLSLLDLENEGIIIITIIPIQSLLQLQVAASKVHGDTGLSRAPTRLAVLLLQ